VQGHGIAAAEPALSRRRALVAALCAGLAPLLPARLAAQDDGAFASLGAVLDTLLPDDGLTPAASALGIEAELRALIAGNDLMTRLFAAALGWMDGLAPVPFRDLPEADRLAVLDAMATADPNQVPGRFYHILRALAVELYYARPESLAGLPLAPAPQPFGYPPPWG
jgi:hypothetical protein